MCYCSNNFNFDGCMVARAVIVGLVLAGWLAKVVMA